MSAGTDKNPPQATVTNVFNHVMRPKNVYSMLDTETVLEVRAPLVLSFAAFAPSHARPWQGVLEEELAGQGDVVDSEAVAATKTTSASTGGGSRASKVWAMHA